MSYEIPAWFSDSYGNNNIWPSPVKLDQIAQELNELDAYVRSGIGETGIQNFLKPKPYLFDGLYRHGHGTYLFSEKSLGPYRTDWLSANGSSAGLTWNLIELECPVSTPFKKDGHFSDAARKGINQIRDWRQWISDNQQHVNLPPINGGLGFHNLRHHAKGIVVVGRRDLYCDKSGIERYHRHREDLKSSERIYLISYDTLLEDMRSRINRPPPNAGKIIGKNKEGRPILLRSRKNRPTPQGDA